MVFSSLLLSAAHATAPPPDVTGPSEAELGDLIVTAPRPPAQAATVLVIDARQPGSADVASVIDQAAGTSVSELGGLGDYAAVSLRGSAVRQVEVFLDGVPLNPEGGNAVNLRELPLAGLSRIEVYRNGAPPEFAAAPIGGVINLVTREGAASRVNLEGGSWGTLRFSAVAAGARSEGRVPADALLVLDGLHTEGRYPVFNDHNTRYVLTDDRVELRENNQKSQSTGHLRLRLGGPALRLTLLDGALARDEGVPGPINLPASTARLRTTRNLAVAELSHQGGPRKLKFRFWRQDRKEILDDRLGELGAGGQWQEDRLSSTGLLASGKIEGTPWFSASLTGLGRLDRYHLTDLSTGVEAGPRQREAAALSPAAELLLIDTHLVVAPVVQLVLLHEDGASAEATDPTRTHSVDPRLAARWRFWPGGADRLDLVGSVGRYLRPPDLTELYGDHGSATGNPELRPERGWAADLGVDAGTVRRLSLSGQLSGFFREVEDLVVWVQNAQQTMRAVNVGRARIAGLEFGNELSTTRLDHHAALTWTVSQNLSADPAVAGRQLPRVPTWELSEELSLHWNERLRLGYNFSFTDGNWWDATNRFAAAPRALHGAFIRCQPTVEWPTMELGARNLTNHIAEVVPRDPLVDDGALAVAAVTDFSGYPLPGRTFSLSLTWER